MFGRFFPHGSGAAPPLLDLDFSGFTIGPHSAASFLSDTGLTIVRSTISTVQTSASTIDVTAAIDDACIGSINGSVKGLVIQHNTRNGLGGTTSPRNLTNAWAGGTQSTTYPFADSPDGSGTGCSRTTGVSGTFSNYGQLSSAARRCFSSWQRSTNAASNGEMQQVWITTVPGDGIQVVKAATNTWGRLVLPGLAVSRQYFAVCDSRDYSGSGGQTGRTRDVLVDYILYELGDFATEAIPGASDYRSNDRISYPTGSDLVESGRVKFYTKFFPKHASTMDVYYNGSSSFSGAASAWYLWSFEADATNFARINASDKKLSVKIANGSTYTSTNAISWAQYDQVEIYMEIGSGTSIAKYSINGGAWTDLVMPSVPDVAAPTTAFTFFANDLMSVDTADSGHLPCWVSSIKMYGVTGAPTY